MLPLELSHCWSEWFHKGNGQMQSKFLSFVWFVSEAFEIFQLKELIFQLQHVHVWHF